MENTGRLRPSGFSYNLEFCYKLMTFSQLIQPPEGPLSLAGSKFAMTSVSSGAYFELLLC